MSCGRRLLPAAFVAIAMLLAACTSSDQNGSPAAEPDDPPVATTGDDAVTDASPDDVAQAGTEPLPALPDDVALPIVFVHGFAGSAQQYETQAMRFAANGYPQDRIVAYEHDGAGFDLAAYAEGLEAFVDTTLAEHDAEQVYLVGHSRGTPVSLAFLAQPGRVEQVARLILIDGAPCPEPEVVDVPCLAPNQAAFPGQAHVEVATSAESFVAQFEFLVGEPPEVVDVVPQRAPVVLEGRAVNFPANTGREGVTLDIWAIDGDTGQRQGAEPHATFELGPDGAFGPVEVATGGHYEYVLSSPDSEVQHHLYLQPYVRSSRLVRLLSSPPDGDTRANTNTGDAHAALVVMRMREWYAVDHSDADGARRDVLEVVVRTSDGTLTDPFEVLGEFVGNGAIGLHLHDGAATPGRSTGEPLPYFSDAPFQSGVDVFMPASPAGDGTISVRNLPRGDRNRPQVINVPNWPSSRHSISVVFADHAML